MAAYTFETSIVIGNGGDSVPAIVDPFRDALAAISGGDFELSALTAPPAGTGSAFSHVTNDGSAIKFTYGLGLDAAALVPSGALLYTHFGMGMEIDEWLSWWYQGGAALFEARLVAAGVGAVVFPIMLRPGEASGWYREAVSLKKLNDGKWSDGTAIKWRGFLDEIPIHQAAFPNVFAGSSGVGVSFLTEVFNSVFNCGEYNEPWGDIGPVNGLFPNWPNVAGSIIDAGCPHYYMSSWHSACRVRMCWVNRTFYNSLSANDKIKIEVAAKNSCLSNIAYAMGTQDAIIKTFQDLGAIVHAQMPMDVLTRIRDVSGPVMEARAALDLTGSYTALLQSQQAFIRANGAKWSAYPDRRWRFQRKDYQPALNPNC